MSYTKLRIALILSVLSMAAIPCSSHVVLAAEQDGQSPEEPEIFVGEPSKDDLALRFGEAAIRKVLRRKVEFEWIPDIPLESIIHDLRHEYKIPIVFDYKEIEKVLGIIPNETLTAGCDYRGISLGSALELMLGQLQLTWVIDKDVLLITTREREGSFMLTTKVHEVADLVMRRDEQDRTVADYDSLENLITTTVRLESWEDVGGPGTMRHQRYRNAETLAVRQTARIHEEIEKLLADIRAVAAAQDGQPTAAEKLSRNEKAIRRALRKKTTIRCKDVPLNKLVARLRKEYRIVVEWDRYELEHVPAWGDPIHAPVSCDYTNISLRSALELMLAPVELTWVIHNEVLLITSVEKADRMLDTRVHDVTDLVMYRVGDGRALASIESLEDVIMTVVSPYSWDQVGGPGITGHLDTGNAKILVVRQSMRVHEEVEKLLADLRATAEENRRKHGDAPLPLRITPIPPRPGVTGPLDQPVERGGI
ncbi:MAG: hypothetical protein HQ581_16610 [Planctomycetes bacterium]|nr:hypothetical protein [Planctomycetota bacterium]